MYLFSWPIGSLLLPVFLSQQQSFTFAKNHHTNDPDLFHFVTRPGIKAPRWEVTIHDSEKLSEGYWFIAAKPSLDRTIGSGDGWWGPAIYDGNGELIWSGADQLDTPNVMDFRMSDVDGEDMMTMLDRDRADGVIIDNHFEIRDIFLIDTDKEHVNAHELNYVEDGKSVLLLRNDKRNAPQDERDSVGYKGDECRANYMSFFELDATNNYETLFEWHGYGHIRLNESTMLDNDIENRCNTYDFIHANSVDKTPDGNYLFSSRHCDTIYKISHEDGSIMWRLGGGQSDFELGEGVKFSRQHNIRSRGLNSTHELVSMLDNAKGQDSQSPSHDFSRGLLIALNMETMKAELVAHYDNPSQSYAPRRGNMHVLDNGNVWMGWSERAQQSEHSPDGTLLMEARFVPDWIGSYRNYKAPFVGKPLTDPDVSSAVYYEHDSVENCSTWVFVSWNGDTEVKNWKLYGTTSEDGDMELINSTKRIGFETAWNVTGYLRSVRLEGLDKNDDVIGKSAVVKTVPHPSMPKFPVDGSIDIEDHSNADNNHLGPLGRRPWIPIVLFVLAAVISATLVLLAWIGVLPLGWVAKLRRRMRRNEPGTGQGQYEKVALEDQDPDSDQYRDQEDGESLAARKLRLQEQEQESEQQREREQEEQSLIAERTPTESTADLLPRQ